MDFTGDLPTVNAVKSTRSSADRVSLIVDMLFFEKSSLQRTPLH